MTELGHVVYYVRNLEASVEFYSRLVGLEVGGRLFNGRAALLTGGRTHHELLLIEVGEADGPLASASVGLEIRLHGSTAHAAQYKSNQAMGVRKWPKPFMSE